MTSTRSDPVYRPENVSLFETIYGKNLISLGGFPAVELLFSGLTITGKKALDLGFGLGGVAFYLAQSYQMQVYGIEVHSWMAQYALEHAPQESAHLLTFDVYNEQGEIPFETQSFDIVYSKGVLNHVHDKETLFHKVNNMLKPSGLFVIADWIFLEPHLDLAEPLVHETKETYSHILTKTGFGDIHFRDDSKAFHSYVKDLLENLIIHQKTIEQTFGLDVYATVLNQQQKLLQDIEAKRKFAMRIIAKKK